MEKKQADGKQIRFADINSVVDMKTGLEDGVHPNETGYAYLPKEEFAELADSYSDKAVVEYSMSVKSDASLDEVKDDVSKAIVYVQAR